MTTPIPRRIALIVSDRYVQRYRVDVKRLLWILESDVQVTVIGLSDFIAKYGTDGDSAEFVKKLKQDFEGLTSFGQTTAKEIKMISKIINGAAAHFRRQKESAP